MIRRGVCSSLLRSCRTVPAVRLAPFRVITAACSTSTQQTPPLNESDKVKLSLQTAREKLKVDGDISSFTETVRELAQQNPNNTDVLIYLGDAARMVGEYDLSIASLTNAVNLGLATKDRETINKGLVLRAECYQRMGKFREAEKDLRNLLAAEPSHALAHERLGYILFTLAELAPANDRTRFLKDALSEFGLSLKLNENSTDNFPIASTYYGMGLVMQRLNLMTESIEVLSAATKADPSFAPAHFARSAANIHKRDWPQAISDLTLFIESFEYYKVPPELTLGTNNDQLLSEAVYRRGVCYHQLGHFDMAESDFTAVINMQASLVPDAFFRRARCHFDRNEYWKAVEDATSSLSLDATNIGAFFIRGSAYEKLGQNDKAADDNRMYQLLSRQKMFKST